MDIISISTKLREVEELATNHTVSEWQGWAPTSASGIPFLGSFSTRCAINLEMPSKHDMTEQSPAGFFSEINTKPT